MRQRWWSIQGWLAGWLAGWLVGWLDGWMLVLQGPVLGTIRAVCISASSVFSEYAAGGSSGVDIMPAEFESPVLKIWSEATAMHLGYQLWSRRRENCAHIAKGLALTSLFATLA
jgi:hypothetical protein